MLVKQRDNEIAILVGYLNKKKESGGDSGGMPGLPVQRANESNYSNSGNSYHEESKQPTLYQMMKGPQSPRVNDKTAAEKRRDFELA